MVQRPSHKSVRLIPVIAGALLLLIAFALLAGVLDPALSKLIAEVLHRPIKLSWSRYFRLAGILLFGAGVGLLAGKQIQSGLYALVQACRLGLERSDEWLKEKNQTFLDPQENTAGESLRFNRWDVLVILFCTFIAVVYQLIVMSPGYPTVILGGDAANIASFAAGRAYPELFKSDAMLGNLNNLGLYVTIHLPLIMWLEKLVGNFGLAFVLLLWPHTFLQYFSYYWLGRVLYQNRYWAFLFSLAVSAPVALAAGEGWGAAGEAIPRVTFQVLIPFVLILLLTTWREKPNRWPWIMVIAGLMAFVHPVSTPTWAFALWIGFWAIFPQDWNTSRKLQELFKLGIVLTVALLPYVSIYLHYHQSGQAHGNYDLVHTILVEYFPANILDIPAAVHVLLKNTAKLGLLWYGMGGLIFTTVFFPSVRPRIKQLLVWMMGIGFVSLLIPWVEIEIERTFRLIPLQTELMRGMRYLVPFLFIFWFYPFAELTNRSIQRGFTWAVLAAGTLLTISWLMINPPDPLVSLPAEFTCMQSGRLICPSNTDESAALTYVREQTPPGSKFVVFLTNRWSGLEVRYLGLRPMVYAFKDKGLLLFSNINSLEQWNLYQQREDDIFRPRISPTLADKQLRIVKFAHDTGADYIFTNFAFPTEVQQQLHVVAVYQNSTYYVLKINADSP